MLCHFAQWHRIYVRHIHGEIDDGHHDDAQHHRARHITARLFDFSSDPGDVHPPVICPENRNQSDAQSGDQLVHAQAHGDPGILSMPPEISPAALADSQAKNHERAHRDKLRPGRDILQDSALPQADDIHPGLVVAQTGNAIEQGF